MRWKSLIHECSSCSNAELCFEAEDSCVFLNLNRVATEEDLENDHLLESEGQTIETVKLEVAFCPYCGKKLSSGDRVVAPTFQHFNFGRKNEHS